MQSCVIYCNQETLEVTAATLRRAGEGGAAIRGNGMKLRSPLRLKQGGLVLFCIENVNANKIPFSVSSLLIASD